MRLSSRPARTRKLSVPPMPGVGTVFAVVVMCAGLSVSGASSQASTVGRSVSANDHELTRSGVSKSARVYPVGVVDSAEPSGMAPPGASSLDGYSEIYSTDFNGTVIPSGWNVFTGAPQGDPGGQWSSSHVVVGAGMLQLNAWRDPAYGNEWVTGGLCQCGRVMTYGAYFVRSRLSGQGPTEVESLWPIAGWPPEVDFVETYGPDTQNMATVHYNVANNQTHRVIAIDMTMWHTWGVIWTSSSLTFTVDGRVWGSVTDSSVISDQPMTLDLQQQTWCGSNFACPNSPESVQIDWVAEYTHSGATAAVVNVSPFAKGSSSLTSHLRTQIDRLVRRIKTNNDTSVELIGYGDGVQSTSQNLSLGRARALAVRRYLTAQLGDDGLTGLSIKLSGNALSAVIKGSTRSTPESPTVVRRVTALLS